MNYNEFTNVKEKSYNNMLKLQSRDWDYSSQKKKSPLGLTDFASHTNNHNANFKNYL